MRFLNTATAASTVYFVIYIFFVFVIEMLNFVQGFDGILIQLID